MPQVRESISSPASHDWRPRAIAVLGVHRGAFRQQELCSLDFAHARGPVERRPTSGAFPGPVGRCGFTWDDGEEADADERSGQLSSTRSTDKRTMNVSGFNIFKSVQSKKALRHNRKHTEKVSIHLVSDKLPSMKRCL